MSVEMPRENFAESPASNASPSTPANIDDNTIRSLFAAVNREKNNARIGSSFQVSVWLNNEPVRTLSIKTAAKTVTYEHQGATWKKNSELEPPASTPEVEFTITERGIQVKNDSGSICARLQRLWEAGNRSRTQ